MPELAVDAWACSDCDAYFFDPLFRLQVEN
ncbi:hypothetical protein DSM3645_09512 [Blastopirellula marina DSM 3645]|uniref:Uncharacterized protein n=1 Tax=Blastopirellula marina DSM 3645 TaxID=314230 RepID=A3ZLJ3_9BACT|nr:hypothetical protein DSM3645_09512 [Blastopirellula marina DSM 3645]